MLRYRPFLENVHCKSKNGGGRTDPASWSSRYSHNRQFFPVKLANGVQPAVLWQSRNDRSRNILLTKFASNFVELENTDSLETPANSVLVGSRVRTRS